MNNDVILTCAITGAGDTVKKNKNVPVTPEEIANSAIESAEAGASIVHIHVRDPVTGKGSRNPELFSDVVHRIRSSKTDVVINLTAGMGGIGYLIKKIIQCLQKGLIWLAQMKD